jgi:hypothetical protein
MSAMTEQFIHNYMKWVEELSREVAAKLRTQYYLWKYHAGENYAYDHRDRSICENNSYKLDKLVSSCEEIILKEAAEYEDMFTELSVGSGKRNDSQEKSR